MSEFPHEGSEGMKQRIIGRSDQMKRAVALQDEEEMVLLPESDDLDWVWLIYWFRLLHIFGNGAPLHRTLVVEVTQCCLTDCIRSR